MDSEPAEIEKNSGVTEVGPPSAGGNFLRYLKITGYVLVFGLIALFLLLNSQTTEVNLIFRRYEMPLFIVLFGCLVVGALLGAGSVGWRGYRKRKQAKQADK